MSELRIGVIGAGGRGVVARWAHHPDIGSRVVACCDLNEAALEHSRELYGREVFTTPDYRALLELDLEAVFVTTPDFLHEEHAVAALKAGKAVYLEKPMAISIESCDRILAAAQRTGQRLYVGHNMRHMPFVVKMKELIDAGAIGEVKTVWCRHFVGNGGDSYFKNWNADRRYSTSLLLQKAAHDLDVIHWFAGAYTEQVQAMGALTLYDQVTDRHAPEERGNPKPNMEHWPPLSQRQLNPTIDVEDLNLVQMRLENGVLASYQQCHYTPDYWRNYTVIGTEGRMENFGNTQSGTTVKVWNRRHWSYDADGDESFSIEPGVGGHGGADVRIVEEFLRYVREGGATQTSPIAARQSVATGCRAAESLRGEGGRLSVPPVPPEIKAYFEKR